MRPAPDSSSRTAWLVGGWSLIAATALFATVFVYLATTFDYPIILDRHADQVLPRLLALGATGRAVWVLYGLIPLLLVPTAIGVDAAARATSPRLSQAGVILAVLSAVCMTAGLLRWPSLQWQLALAHEASSPAARETIAVVFAAANSYLGTFVGEFLGELFLNAFFLCASIALARAGGPSRRWLLYVGATASVLGGLAMLRNVTPAVALVASANNTVLPIWMLVLGVALLKHAGSIDIPPRHIV